MTAIILIQAILWFYLRDLTITRGEELYQISEQVGRIRRQNMLLREQILHYSSLTYIASEAADMGFVEAKVLYLK